MKKFKIILPALLILSIVVFAGFKSINPKDNSLKTNDSKENITEERRTVSQEVKDFWYDGNAELSSYDLEQARYGETHKGTAVLVYVAEPFSKKANTKADYDNPENVPVLKLNKTLKFNTGIYPYSLMNSTFFPLENGNSSLKATSSFQEWCGMTYLEMKNEGDFIFDFNSYYEGFTFKDKKVKRTTLEDDLWSLIRLNPELLPKGTLEVIPTMSFLRLRNREPKAYKAIAAKTVNKDGVSQYSLEFPSLERKLIINYETAFPHQILGWEDTHYSGYGEEKNIQTSKATLRKSVKTDYWNQNHNKDAHWRGKLGLN